MLRRAAQSLRSTLQHSSTLLKTEMESALSSKPIQHKIPLRQFAENAAAAAAPQTPSSPPPSKQGIAAVPGIIKALGFGGAIPFWAFSPAIANQLPLDLLGDAVPSQAGLLQISYGATIISFLGGVHWGLAMTSLTPVRLMNQRYIWSVLPCLTAWPTLTMPLGQAAGIQAALLGFVYMVDRGWFKRGGLPGWYISMRLPLTVMAAAGLAMTAVTETA